MSVACSGQNRPWLNRLGKKCCNCTEILHGTGEKGIEDEFWNVAKWARQINSCWTKPLRGGLKLATTYVTSVDPFSVAGPSLEDDPIPPLDEKA
jgi:hypothetical protein